MNIPNSLTLLRIMLLIPTTIFFYMPGFYIISLICILFAWLTDILDGIIAKRFNMQTQFGAFTDPTVDKFLVLAIFIVLVDLKIVPMWIAVLIIGRDVLVQAIRNIAESHNRILKSYWTGKIKFGLQMLTFASAAFVLAFGFDISIVYWIAVITLLESYYALGEFLWKNRDFLMEIK